MPTQSAEDYLNQQLGTEKPAAATMSAEDYLDQQLPNKASVGAYLNQTIKAIPHHFELVSREPNTYRWVGGSDISVADMEKTVNANVTKIRNNLKISHGSASSEISEDHRNEVTPTFHRLPESTQSRVSETESADLLKRTLEHMIENSKMINDPTTLSGDDWKQFGEMVMKFKKNGFNVSIIPG